MAKPPRQKVLTKKHLARLEREHLQSRWIMIVSIVILVLILATIGYGFLNEDVLKYRQPVAQVGNVQITRGDFFNHVEYYRYQELQQFLQTKQFIEYFGSALGDTSYYQNSLMQLQNDLTGGDPTIIGTTVLDQMIQDRLVRREAAKRGITVSSAEVDKALSDFFSYYPSGTPTPTVTPTAWATSTLSTTQLALFKPTDTPTVTPTLPATPTISATSTPTAAPSPTATPGPSATPGPTDTPYPTATPYTEAGYQAAKQKYLDTLKPFGITETDLRYLLESQLYQQKLTDALSTDLTPVQDQVWARHILVADQATADNVLKRLKNGEDFAKVAKEVSTDTSTKDQGGDLGWFSKGQMVAEFETAAWALKIGEISQPVKSQYGYHIIQVLGHENRIVAPQALSQEKTANFQKWLDTAKTQPDVKKMSDWSANLPTTPTINPQDMYTPSQ